jgi:hypothetical protein
MKTVKYFVVLLASLMMTALAQASVINISMDPVTGLPASDVNKGLLGDNSPLTNFNFLLGQIDLYNTFHGTSLQDPTFSGYFDGSSNIVDLTGFDYAVIHYGKGPGGTGQGGGVEFFYLNGMNGNYIFPAMGLGPNGVGGFSSIRLFSIDGVVPTPENGTTLLLLGVAVAGLVATQRLVRA